MASRGERQVTSPRLRNRISSKIESDGSPCSVIRSTRNEDAHRGPLLCRSSSVSVPTVHLLLSFHSIVHFSIAKYSQLLKEQLWRSCICCRLRFRRQSINASSILLYRTTLYKNWLETMLAVLTLSTNVT